MELFKNKKIDKDWSFSEYKPSETSKWTNCYHRYFLNIYLKFL